MKTGEAYIHSVEKRWLDLSIATAARPLNFMARKALEHSFARTNIDLSPWIVTPRTGKDLEKFSLYKSQTLDPETLLPLNNFCIQLRKLGIDELGQIRNVRENTMSIVGPRPLVPEDTEMVRDSLTAREQKYFDATKSIKPGIVSTVAIESHTGALISPNERVLMDYEDMRQASAAQDIRLITRLALNIIEGKMSDGMIDAVPDEAPASPLL